MTGSAGHVDLTTVALHRHPEYMDECMKLLNEQWPRSNTLRLRSLNSSCDKFPTSLALLRKHSKDVTEVIGHGRINILPREVNGAWVESVIIRSDLRGKGYGKILMNKIEEYAITSGFSTVFLSTHDQQAFYSKLGYDFCAPVCIYGGAVNTNLLPKQFLPSLMPVKNTSKISSPLNNIESVKNLYNKLTINCGTEETIKPSRESAQDVSVSKLPPPPPPPPPKLKKEDITKIDISKASKMYMKKQLI